MPSRERRPFAVGNWKMHKTLAEGEAWLDAVTRRLSGVRTTAGVAAPYVHLTRLAERARGGALQIGAQNCHHEAKGAYTGEVSAPMLRDAGAVFVVLGHSERRRDFAESDGLVRRKLEAAAASGLTAIVCIGETLAERTAGRTEAVLAGQIEGVFAGGAGGERRWAEAVVVAYEPVWAIGTGRNATPGEAQDACAFVRGRLGAVLGASAAERTRILYGGSVTADNAASVLGGADIDGALVGGASLDAETFATIVATLDGARG